MKTVLSIKQPFAWLIVSGAKDVENRDWPTRFRGEFYVHAGKYRPSESELREIEAEFHCTIDRSALEFGGIIGATSLVDCVDSHESKWFVGDYGFVLRDSRSVPFTPLRGRLGFFRVS